MSLQGAAGDEAISGHSTNLFGREIAALRSHDRVKWIAITTCGSFHCEDDEKDCRNAFEIQRGCGVDLWIDGAVRKENREAKLAAGSRKTDATHLQAFRRLISDGLGDADYRVF